MSVNEVLTFATYTTRPLPPCWHGEDCFGTRPDCQCDPAYCWTTTHVEPHTCDYAEVEARRELSRLLFEARESCEMWADVVEKRVGPDTYTRGLVERIDAYRAARGWSPHGFGGET